MGEIFITRRGGNSSDNVSQREYIFKSGEGFSDGFSLANVSNIAGDNNSLWSTDRHQGIVITGDFSKFVGKTIYIEVRWSSTFLDYGYTSGLDEGDYALSFITTPSRMNRGDNNVSDMTNSIDTDSYGQAYNFVSHGGSGPIPDTEKRLTLRLKIVEGKYHQYFGFWVDYYDGGSTSYTENNRTTIYNIWVE